MQNQPHRVLNCSPYELRFQKSIFDDNQNILQGFNITHKERILAAGEMNLKKINANRKNYRYTIGEKVYKKILTRKKLTPYWTGPFEICALDSTQNVVTITCPSREEKINGKLVRPIKEGQDVRPEF